MQRIAIILFLWLSPAVMRAQTVSGTVTDSESQTAIAGATVVVLGTTKGTFTDQTGRFEVSASSGDTLLVRFLGYDDRKLAVTGTDLQIQMTQNEFELDEVQVIGYGTQAVKDFTGSIASVSSEDFNQGNMVTPENLLNGRVAGVSINTGGAPGSGSTIRIRGGSSLDASNDPLIVINGLPISNNAIGGSRSILSTINPNDIESFTILKDASATAIYGSRASNGVILITTKKGSQQLRINLNSQIGYSTLTDQIDVFTGDEFRELVAVQRPDLVGLLGDANTNWQDEIYQDVVFHTHNLSVEGSLFNVLPARLSLGLTDQPGSRLTSEFNRNTASLNLNPSLLNDHLNIAINANFSQEKNRFAQGQEGNAISFDPTQPVYLDSSPFGGFFEYFSDNNDGVFNSSDLISNSPGNPVASLLQRNDRSTVYRLFGNAKIDYRLPFFPALKAVVNLGLDDASGTGFIEIDSANRIFQPNGDFVGSFSEYTNDQRNVLLDGYLAYEEEFNNLRMDVTMGYSYQKFESAGFTSGEQRNDLPDTEPVTSVATDLVLIGLFTRANFSLSEKYLATVSYRRDATSRFSPQNRWGNFPAVALGWRINEEFFSNSKKVSNLKLRLGWGITGQQDIGSGAELLFLQRYNTALPSSQYAFGGQPITVALPQFRNEELTWEETTTYNLGLDFGFFNNRLNSTVELFFKESRDLLAFAAISDGSNFSNSGFQNIGEFTSQGIEFSVDYDIFRPTSGDFSWNVSFNATVIKTEIQDLALDQDVRVGGIAGGVGGTIQLHRVGYAPYKFFVYKQVYNENGDPIEGAYVDLNGDNLINDEDRYLHRNNQPEATLGFQTRMAYKGLDFSFNLRASIGNYMYNNVNSARAQYDLIQNVQVLSNLPSSVLASNFTTTPTVILSDYYMEDASFLRMDNLNLGYTFQGLFQTRLNARLGLGAQNVFVLTTYSGIDPEIFSGIDNTIYPRARTFLVSLNLSY